MPRRWLLAIAIFLTAASARAELVVGGPSAFLGQVRTCLELFSAADQETKDIIANVQQARPPGERHVIGQGVLAAGVLGQATPTNPSQARPQPQGGNGTGSGSTITLDPSIPAAQLCAILLHELKHASDFENGADKQTQPPRPRPGAGIPDAEIDAMREENRYRKHAGLPQVPTYGGIPLPPDAIFN